MCKWCIYIDFIKKEKWSEWEKSMWSLGNCNKNKSRNDLWKINLTPNTIFRDFVWFIIEYYILQMNLMACRIIYLHDILNNHNARLANAHYSKH